MKIVTKRSLGIQPVYDIGLEYDHNFLIGGGFFASNCFNKSHSVAYGYITYQTAYLKANYPVEYMAALLSSASDDQSKVQKYIANCGAIGIGILPPDINTSDVTFTPRGGEIVFGLAAIKNLGMGAIEAILIARKDGHFQSLGDLCRRADAKSLNKKALEALVQAGAMDSIYSNRRQLMQNIESTVEWAAKRSRDKASGQGNLFEVLGAQDGLDIFDEPPTTPPVEDFLPQEKLRLEKELLGFYISDHPLKSISKSASLMAPINLSDLEETPENLTVTAIVLILDIKLITTKKGDRMAALQLEDLSGSAEAIIFPKSYEKVKDLLEKDRRLMVWGKVDRKEEPAKLFIDDMQPIEEVNMVRLTLSREQALNMQVLHQLQSLLQGCPRGKTPVIAQIEYLPHMIRLGNQFWVENATMAVSVLDKAGFPAFSDTLLTEIEF